MSSIENIYVCLAAPLLLSLFFLRRGWRRVLLFLLAGMTVCLLSAYISTFFAVSLGADLSSAAYEISPMVEEVMKLLPVLFYLMIFEPRREHAISGILIIAVGFATFENVCFLTNYGVNELFSLVIRGFGTGAMHVVCGAITSVGLLFLWDQMWLRAVGTIALLSLSITFHAIFNILVNQQGAVSLVGSLIPLLLILLYLLFVRKNVLRINANEARNS